MFRIHHPPQGEKTVSDFTVELNGQKTHPWFCRVSALPYNTVWPGFQRPIDQTEIASFVSLEMDSDVTVKIIAAKDFSELVVRPISKGISAQCNGREITFTIVKYGYYTVELDGFHNAFHIFANPVSDFGVDIYADDVLYYGPGVHEIGSLELKDGQTLYVDGGAVLYGSVMACHKKNVSVVGYGIIDGSREERTDDTLLIAWTLGQGIDLRKEDNLRKLLKDKNVLEGCVHYYSCVDSRIEGVIARDSSTFAFIVADCERTNCEWLKTIGMWRYNSDGIDLFNSRYVRIANCFLRNFDDCIVIKGIEGWDSVDQHHIIVTKCTIWCDWGRALEIGAETNADEYYDILWDDCDLIHGAHIYIDIQNTSRAWVHDMVVRNIRCEYSKHDRYPVYQHDMNASYPAYGKPWQPVLIASPITDGPYSSTHILGRTSNIHFEDIQILCHDDMPMPECQFSGMDDIHCNQDIVIENITRNGKPVKPSDVVVIKSEYDKNIIVK